MKMLFFKKNLSLKLTLYCFAIPLFLLLQGCLESENKLTLKKDGSGQLEVMYILGEELTQELEQAQKSEDNTTARPIFDGLVTTEKDLREQFQGEGIKIEKAVFEKKEEKLHVFYTVTFDTLQNLLNAKQNLLNTKAFRQGEASFYRDKNNNLGFQMETESIRKDLEQKKRQGPYSVEFTLILPGKILESNADQIEENALFWRYNQDKAQPEIMKATCEGKGLTFLDTLFAGPKKPKSGGYIYDPTGKPDPFKPFILEVKRRKEEADKAIQPLQKYELSQLKLVAIIWNIDNPRALVEDSAGKGYIITKGSSIGNKQGKVTGILENEIVITEESADIFGETKTKAIRIKLHTGAEEERKGK
jgi:Tfp pilus assembly protein PilP